MNREFGRREDEDDLLAALFEGGFETPLWATFLRRLRTATAADYAILNFRPPGRPIAETLDLLSGDVPASVIQQAHRKFFPSTGPAPGEMMGQGEPYSLDQLIGLGGASYGEVHREFLAQSGIGGIRQMRVQEATGVHAWLTIARRGVDFEARDEALMRAIAPALRGVLRHYVALERERFTASLTAEAVRRLQFGWLTLDAAGQVLDCDEQGALVLAQSGVLSRSAGGRLSARPAALEREIFQALKRIAENPQSRPHAITLNREPWLDMLVTPAPRKLMSARTPPVAIAYVHGDSWSSVDRCEQLAELFGLLPREARLALALCRGMTIAEAATAFGLTVESARTYSKGIYQKTGARGLPDLVRIVMRSVLAIAPEA